MESMKKYTFHVLGLAHLPTSEEYMACAFTQKNYKLCKMLMNMGHKVYLYGSEGSKAPCTELVETHTLKDIRDAWGDGDNRYEIGYDWHSGQFRHDINEFPKKPVTMKYYSNAIQEINKRKKPDDFLIITQGTYQKPIDMGVGLYLTAETGIGYRGSYTKWRAFESTYIQYFTYGSEHPRQSINGAFYDRTIPNYFDTNDFPFVKEKEDYFLFMGRMIQRKGVHIAIETCQHLKARLILAGQLSDEISLDYLKGLPNVEFVGFADAKKRAELMGKARAVFTPSTYLEPFCGVHAEAMLCGTPVITTNFGAFTDYVYDGINGFKCDTLNDFVKAAIKVGELKPEKVRETAERFTLEEVSKLYQKWFDDLMQVYKSTKDPKVKGWHYIEPHK
jgi:glycosyltransferase involved in cell wall biosynthesis